VKNHPDHRYNSRTSDLMMSLAEAAIPLCAELQIALQKCVAGEFFRSFRKHHGGRNQPQQAKSGLQSIKKQKGKLHGSAFIDVHTVAVDCDGHPRAGIARPDGAGKMKLRVLGCAGGIGGHQRFTTCLLLDDDILLDAGTGISNLNIDELVRIDHVFITHCHLDHVAGLALLVDAVRGKRQGAVTVHASEDVVAALRKYLFNWVLWPDFSMIPSVDEPVLRWQPFKPGATIAIDGRMIAGHSVNHTPGAVAYWAHAGNDGFLFSGDMCATPALWETLLLEKGLRKVIVDCSFPNAEFELAAKSMHFCPQSLLNDIHAMPHSIEFLIYHLKPGQEDLIMEELRVAAGDRPFKALKCGDVFIF
jgi:glyoxylase-like metal-dependent hydrolase (beta-lactamase superfamily II)